MLKVRNLLLIFIVNYLLILAFSVFFELNALNSKAIEVMRTVKKAGDISLDQTQAIDEYLASSSGEGYEIAMPSVYTGRYEKVDFYHGIWDIDSSDPNNKLNIFRKLYDTNDFKILAGRTAEIRMPVKYWDTSKSGFLWYTIPRAMVMGRELYPDDIYTQKLGVRFSNGVLSPESIRDELYVAYGLMTAKKVSNGVDYYSTPLSYGVTYINTDLLTRLFVNNMDSIMRYRYRENLNTADGGHGLLKGKTYADRIEDELVDYNPINNGVFTYLRGECMTTSVGTQSCIGIEPTVTYRVIDMYNEANDTVLKHLFGANTGGFRTKAEYLKNLDSSRLNPITNQPYDSKPIVVARVTFYADVVIPYFGMVIRDLRTDVDPNEHNYADLQESSPTGTDGSRRITYTRLFAVTP